MATTGPGPTVRRRQLGMELRQLREAQGLSCGDVGDRLDWSGAKVSRIETARNAVHPNDLRLLLDLYGVTDTDRRNELVQLARTSRQRGWWNAYRDVVPERRWVYVRLEDEATLIRGYEAEFVPGLLQTEDYARACLKAVRPTDTLEAIDRRVSLRMARQPILTRDSAPRLWVILNEAVLHRVAALPAKAAGEQFDRLVSAAELPNVTLQVLPFRVGPHAGMDGAFTILRFPDPAGEVVFIEGLVSSPYLDEPDEIQRYDLAFDHLCADALGAKESAGRIKELARENKR